MLQDIYTVSTSSNPTNFVASGSNLFFTATDATHSSQLWAFFPTAPSRRSALSLASPAPDATPNVAALDFLLAGDDPGIALFFPKPNKH